MLWCDTIGTFFILPDSKKQALETKIKNKKPFWGLDL